jgi:hypothetical protein
MMDFLDEIIDRHHFGTNCFDSARHILPIPLIGTRCCFERGRLAKRSFCGLPDVSLNAGLWVIGISAWDCEFKLNRNRV